MSPTALPAATAARPVLLTGWGRTAATAAGVARPRSAQEVADLLANAPPRGVIARGAGRSYGDAAQSAGGLVLDLTALAPDQHIDVATGLVTVSAGTTLDRLLRDLVPLGWFVPVTPGTGFVTVGGAVAADVHGKNHHGAGSFGRHVRGMLLALPTGELRRVTPRTDPELFWATTGGMGLTGVVLEVTFQAVPIRTSQVRVTTERASCLDDVLERMRAHDDEHRYSVAWIDLTARGRRLGRGVLTRGDHACPGELPEGQRGRALERSHGRPLSAPAWAPPGLLNPATVRVFNALYFSRAKGRPATGLQSISSFFHPLDRIAGWNTLYGPRGFVQYQFVVPLGREDALRRIVERVSASGAAPFLAVLKRLGPADPGPLSFPIPGWTLALDLPVGSSGLAGLLRHLDGQVVDAGGRVYLAKDARLSAARLAQMYPRLAQWQHVRRSVDPDGVLRSDLSRRLGL